MIAARFVSNSNIASGSDFGGQVKIAPRLARIYRNWAIMESNQGYYGKVEELMRTATTLDPDDSTLWFTWGNIEKRRHRLDNGKRFFKKALEIDPDDGPSIAGPAEIEKRVGNNVAAEDLYLKASELPSGRGETHTIVILTARADNFRSWAENCREKNDTDLEFTKLSTAFHLICEALRITRKDERAITTFGEICYDLMHFHGRQNDMLESENYYKKARIPNPKTTKQKRTAVKVNLGWTKYLLRFERYEEAKELFDRTSKFRIPSRTRFESYNRLRDLFSKNMGTLTRVLGEKGYGFIKFDDENIFVHISEFKPRISNDEFSQLENKLVFFKTKDTPKGKEAIEVETFTKFQ